jgi:hypothetical protein
MVSMSDHAAQEGPSQDARMGKAIARIAIVGIPAGILFMTLAVYFITDLDLGDSFATGFLPGVLFGGFASGFAGTVMTMD